MGGVTYSSPGAEALYGWRVEEMMGQSLARLYPIGASLGVGGHRRALEAGSPVTAELETVTKSGALVWVEVTATVLRDAQGEHTSFLDISRDITQRREAEERLLQTEKLRSLGQLASGIAHDLNNVIMVIQGHAELCLRSPHLEAQVQGDLEAILESAADGAQVVRRIQAFHRPIDPAEVHPLEINQVIAATAAQVEGSLPALRPSLGRRVQVQMELSPVPLIAGSEWDLRQLFTNLMLNALDAMPEGGTLTIGSFRQGDWTTVMVRDTGVGMSEELRRRVFEPFFTTKGEAGSGLGLSISHGIVQRHGGEILVESQPGKGSTFTLHFPVLTSEESPTLELGLQGAETPSMSILVIDDDPFVAQTIADMLSGMGHRVTVATSGHQGIEIATTGMHDLVCTDLGMKGTDGWEVVRAVRERRPDLPVYLLTGYGITLYPQSVSQMGAAGVLSKPVSLDALAALLQRHAQL